MKDENLVRVFTSRHERQWVTHAASLRGMTVRQYVRWAINQALQRSGVDAVLLREPDAYRPAPEGAKEQP